jgi:transposase
LPLGSDHAARALDRRPAAARPISKAGDEDVRRLLALGAHAVVRQAKPDRTAPWLLGLLARKPKKVAEAALANETGAVDI